MVMVGKTGAGKSKVGNHLLQIKKFKSSAIGNSVTSKCEFGKRTLQDGYKLVVVDTPGLFDTSRKNTETSNELARCILLTSPGPHVFLFVLPIGRFTNEEHETIKNLKDIFGEEVMNFVVILFTHRDKLISENLTLDEYLENSPETVKSIIKESSGRCVAINNDADPESLKTDVEDLLKVVRGTIQSNNGQCYTGGMYETAEQVLKEKMKKIEEEKHKRERELDQKERKLTEEMNEQTQKLEEEKQNQRLKEEENQRKNEEEKQKLEEQRQELEQEIERKKQEIEEKNKKHEAEMALEAEKKRIEFEQKMEQDDMKQKKRELEHQKALEEMETERKRAEQLGIDKEKKEKQQQQEENERRNRDMEEKRLKLEEDRAQMASENEKIRIELEMKIKLKEMELERGKIAMEAAERQWQMEKLKAGREKRMWKRKIQQESERQRLDQQEHGYQQQLLTADLKRKDLEEERRRIEAIDVRQRAREDEEKAKSSWCPIQ